MGSGFWFGLLFLVLHLALCGALWLLARSRALEVEGYFLPVALLVPVWGPLCVVLLHTSHRLTDGQLLDRTLEKLRINEEIYKNILVAENEEKDTVVPLEEALLVNSPAQKRKLILSVLTDDPAGYYDLLQQARMDDDSEVVHYASTALAQISKEADLKLQQQEQRYAAAPGDAKVLEEYCDYLESYLDGGFVQGKAAEIQRHQLEQPGCSTCGWRLPCGMVRPSRKHCMTSRKRRSTSAQRAARRCGSGRGRTRDETQIAFLAGCVPLAETAPHLGRVPGHGGHPVCGAQRHPVRLARRSSPPPSPCSANPSPACCSTTPGRRVLTRSRSSSTRSCWT